MREEHFLDFSCSPRKHHVESVLDTDLEGKDFLHRIN